MKPLILLLAGPGGVGKNTILKGLLAARPDVLVGIQKYTTRSPRIGEGNEEFQFVSPETFTQKILDQALIEHNVFNGHAYGVPRQPIDEALQKGKIPVVIVEANGVAALRRAYPQQTLAIFLTAPLTALRQRLLARGDTPNQAEARLKIAQEIEFPNQDHFDQLVTNNDGQAEAAVGQILSFLDSNRS